MQIKTITNVSNRLDDLIGDITNMVNSQHSPIEETAKADLDRANELLTEAYAILDQYE